MSQCVILVGGLGTRLGEAARLTPKPMLEVAGRPFLEYLLAKAARHGFREVLLLAGHRAEVIETWLTEAAVAAWLGVEIAVAREPAPLGTAGALAHARGRLASDFLLVNGDTWFDFDWSGLTLGSADAALALRQVAPADRYETIVLDGGRVREIRPRQPDLAEGQINGGVYRLRRQALDGVEGVASLEAEVLPRLAREGRLAGQSFDGAFIDIGIPESLQAAQALLGEAAE